MIITASRLLALLTFPGIIVHELAHRLCCDIFKVRVFEVCFFRLGDPAGFVIHERPPSLSVACVITLAPLLFNSVVSVLIGVTVGIDLFTLCSQLTIQQILRLWLALSIGMHALPSAEDLRALRIELEQNEKTRGIANVFDSVIKPIPLVKGLLNILWFDLLYAITVCLVAGIAVVNS
ncbi:MAG: metalloprotease family protein [Candidatus Obscuribacterales bacterium]|nr:metalloprotease family protein [Candidatus Obscuribacterales bacterium]